MQRSQIEGENGMETVGLQLHAIFAFDPAPLQPSLRLGFSSASARETLGGHGSVFGAKGVRWTRANRAQFLHLAVSGRVNGKVVMEDGSDVSMAGRPVGHMWLVV